VTADGGAPLPGACRRTVRRVGASSHDGSSAMQRSGRGPCYTCVRCSKPLELRHAYQDLAHAVRLLLRRRVGRLPECRFQNRLLQQSAAARRRNRDSETGHGSRGSCAGVSAARQAGVLRQYQPVRAVLLFPVAQPVADRAADHARSAGRGVSLARRDIGAPRPVRQGRFGVRGGRRVRRRPHAHGLPVSSKAEVRGSAQHNAGLLGGVRHAPDGRTDSPAGTARGVGRLCRRQGEGGAGGGTNLFQPPCLPGAMFCRSW